MLPRLKMWSIEWMMYSLFKWNKAANLNTKRILWLDESLETEKLVIKGQQFNVKFIFLFGRADPVEMDR